MNQFTNPKIVLKKAKEYVKNHPVIDTKPMKDMGDYVLIGKINENIYLFQSDKEDKKYMLYNGLKKIHFGQLGYEDFTKHKDEERRASYLARASKIKGNWKHDPYSPNNLSIHLLW